MCEVMTTKEIKAKLLSICADLISFNCSATEKIRQRIYQCVFEIERLGEKINDNSNKN